MAVLYFGFAIYQECKTSVLQGARQLAHLEIPAFRFATAGMT